MPRDLTDTGAWIERILYRLDRLEGGAMLENSSITEGRMRFIGGLLRIDSGGRVEIVGTLQVDGESTVTGQFTVEGPWALTGDGTITGSVTISGPVEISGDVDLTGTMTVTGDVEVTGSGLVKVGSMTLDPNLEGGAISFENGAQVFTDSGTIQLYLGNSVAQISDDYARIQHGGSVVEINGSGIRMSPGAVPSSTSPEDGHWLQIDPGTGYLRRVAPGIGGPLGGSWEWPFPESTITYGFRPPDRPTHDGIDFAGPEVTGQPVRAAAQGVVAYAGWSSGYGWYVDLAHSAIDGQTVLTRYGHMLDPGPAVSTGDTVPKLGVLGTVGNTGASVGDHLHWELHLDGNPVDPAPFMAVHAAG